MFVCTARAQEEKEIKLRAAVAHVKPSVVRVAMKWKKRALGEAACAFGVLFVLAVIRVFLVLLAVRRYH